MATILQRTLQWLVGHLADIDLVFAIRSRRRAILAEEEDGLSQGEHPADTKALKILNDQVERTISHLVETLELCSGDAIHLPFFSQGHYFKQSTLHRVLRFLLTAFPRLRSERWSLLTEHLVDGILGRHTAFQYRVKVHRSDSDESRPTIWLFDENDLQQSKKVSDEDEHRHIEALISRYKNIDTASWPPLPIVDASGCFDCPYCGEQFGDTQSRFYLPLNLLADAASWHSHVRGDIGPYTCLRQPCWEMKMPTKRIWTRHELRYHGLADAIRIWPTLSGQNVDCKHEDIPDPVLDCPFCDDFTAFDMRDSLDRLEVHQYIDHVTAHMERLVFGTLPYLKVQSSIKSAPTSAHRLAGPSRTRRAVEATSTTLPDITELTGVQEALGRVRLAHGYGSNEILEVPVFPPRATTESARASLRANWLAKENPGFEPASS